MNASCVFYLKVLVLSLYGFSTVLSASSFTDILPRSELLETLQTGGHIIPELISSACKNTLSD